MDDKNTTPLETVDSISLEVNNEEYTLPEGSQELWHVYSILIPAEEEGYFQASVGVLGPTEKTHEDIADWVHEEMFNGQDYTYHGSYDHEPSQEEIDACFPAEISE